MNKVKFVYVTRTIDPKTRIHYLDAIDENGQHWMAEMSHKEEHGCASLMYGRKMCRCLMTDISPELMDEIVDRMVKKHQAQKLYHRLYDELGYDFEDIEDVVDLVEDWLPKEQSAAGSQNVNTELLVEGFNHCVQKMKDMLR